MLSFLENGFHTRVFVDAPDLSPSIQIVRNTLPTNDYTAQVAIFGRGEIINSFKEQLEDKLISISIHDQLDAGWQLTGKDMRTLFTKLMATGKSLGDVIEGRMYIGVKTGLNEAFIINQANRDRLVKDDASSVAIIKPILRGEDLRPWYQENEGRWLICIPNGWTMQTFPGTEPSEASAWKKLTAYPPGLANYLEPFAEAARKRQDKGQFWWELRPCDYYEVFESPKLLFPDIAKKPRFSWGKLGIHLGNTGYCIPADSYAFLSILSSRTIWYVMTYISQPLGERAGALIYRLFKQHMERLPIPPLTDTQRDNISKLSQQLTETAKQRYEVRQKTTHRIENDLGTSQAKLNQRLTSWWELSFQEFREELVKVFKRDIPLKDRDDWEVLLNERSTEIDTLTYEIVRLETELNEAVYEAFGLDAEERKLIEQETKYKYGE